MLLLMTSANAYCGEDLTLVCKGVTTRTYLPSLDEKKIPESKTYIFKNGEIRWVFTGVVCKWSKTNIHCEHPNKESVLIHIDRVSGVVYEHSVMRGLMSDVFHGDCVPAKPKF